MPTMRSGRYEDSVLFSKYHNEIAVMLGKLGYSGDAEVGVIFVDEENWKHRQSWGIAVTLDAVDTAAVRSGWSGSNEWSPTNSRHLAVIVPIY